MKIFSSVASLDQIRGSPLGPMLRDIVFCTIRPMKFALVSRSRQEARPSLSGQCPCCGQPMIAKCGERKAWHWAHSGRRKCDPWWENETDWHREWKNLFPTPWQELVQFSVSGEKHIADVKTAEGWVLEFQHSYIKPNERRSREGFYSNLAWVVNGMRRKRDLQGFEKAVKEGTRIHPTLPAWQVWSHEGTLLRQWAGSGTHVFFDFGAGTPLWWLSPDGDDIWSYVVAVGRANFVTMHQGAESTEGHGFGPYAQALSGMVARYKSTLEARQRRDHLQAAAQMTTIQRPGRRRPPRF